MGELYFGIREGDTFQPIIQFRGTIDTVPNPISGEPVSFQTLEQARQYVDLLKQAIYDIPTSKRYLAEKYSDSIDSMLWDDGEHPLQHADKRP